MRVASDSSRTVANARIAAVDSAGRILLEVTSDSSGRFVLALNSTRPFRIEARKIGVEPTYSDYLRLTPKDTLQMDLSIPTDVTDLPAVEVPAAPVPTRNQLAFEDAVRRGWKVYSPERVERVRERYRDFTDMLRGLQVQGISVSGTGSDCVRNSHFPTRCMTYVLDGVPAGPYLLVDPIDIYFFAIVSATESSVLWGNRAPWGAIVIYTRMHGDPGKP